MKTTLLKSIVGAVAASTAICVSASTTINILDIPWTADTIAYEKVGPGTTHTHLSLVSTANSANKLQVHYLTIDKTAPGVKIRAVKAKDKVAGTETTSAMAKRKSTANTLYFAGCNGDFYATSGTATNGTSKIGMPTTSCTVDGEVIKTSNSNYQFVIDDNDHPLIGRINYYTGTATIGEKVTLFKGINVGSPANGVTIYTPKYFGSTNQTDYTDNSYEVTARLVDGDRMECGGKWRLEVTSEPNTSGDTPVPADGFVIFGRGTSTSGCNTGAKTFVGDLHIGDIVEFDHIPLLGDTRIKPLQIVSGNPRTVGQGLRLDSEGERTDAKDLHPRTGIGYSVTGDSIIMMVVEGRMSGAIGVRTSQLADLMLHAGAYEALNLDGGGSSTLYSSALGVLNRCSDGTERAVGNAIFATIDTDPTDAAITEIRFADWAPRLPRHATYTPRLMGYNAAGLLVSDSIADYTLSCPPGLGAVTADGHAIHIDGQGTHPVTATVGSVTATVPAIVTDDCTFAAAASAILTDASRQYTVRLTANNGLHDIPVDPAVFSWTSADPAIATVDDSATIRGLSNGTTTVTGTVDQQSVAIEVTVQLPRAETENILADFDPEAWKFSKTGCDAATAMTPTPQGLQIDYTVTSTRSLSLTLTPASDYYFWSLPIDIAYELTPSSLPLRTVNLKLADALGGRVSITTDAIPAGTPAEGRFDIAAHLPIDDVAAYPLRLISLTLSPSASVGDTGRIDLTALTAIYPPMDNVGIQPIDPAPACGSDTAAPAAIYDLRGIRLAAPRPGINIIRDPGATAPRLRYVP